MKRMYLFLMLLATGWWSSIAAEDYLMPKWGYEEKTIATGETLSFYDFMGENDIPSSSSSNSYSTVVFKPEEAGYGIQIVFEYIEVKDDGSGWVSYLDVFDGVFDKNLVNNGTYPSSVSGSTTPFSQLATPLKHYENGNFSNEAFLSSDASGALSVCFHYRYAGASRGWKATVTTVKLQDMVLQSATAVYDFIDAEVWAGKENVGLAGLKIVAEGGGNPDALTQISFTLTGTDVVDPSSLAVYAGKDAKVSSLTNTEAVITENAGVYTATLNKTLGNGDNFFTIGGNILSTAAFNATAAVNITGFSTAGGFSTFTPATPVTLTVQPMYLMAEDATYTISGETQFFDEGGKDGKVIKGFNGKVVFTPATEGKKVQLTFNSIDVFYTDYAANSTGYVDYIKVYNGNSTNDADLLWQISQAEASTTTPIVLKSTAADGQLTITHKNNISYDTNLKNGWEAVVSEFIPQAMTVSSVSVSKETGTVSAGTEGKQVACVKVVTAETEPALALQALTFNTNNTHAQLSKAKLYYTKENTFATSRLLGEATITGNQVTLTATNQVNFREGDNYLWLVYDIQPLAANDAKVDALMEKLTFTNNEEYTSFTNSSDALTIENKAVQACGSQTFTVFGDWAYTHTVVSDYNSKYQAEQCDQTVIFKPATAGHVIQIDYTDFDVYYASSSYSTRAKYIVYAGEGTNGEVLWQLDANGKKPTQIRSTGAMTIVFNPNTTSTYYTGNGWHATVQEYKLQNMKIESIAVEQASTKLVQTGERKAALLDVDIQTVGTLNALTLEALTLDLKGTEANIETLYLMQGENVLAQASAAEQVTLTLESPATLAEYANAFTIAADIKTDASVESTVDAALGSVTLSGAAQTVTAGDPEGNRIVKNVRYLQAGNNGTVTIGANSLMFYDDGGADGNYSSDFEGYITFVPATEGCAVELVFKDFDIAYLSGDPFRIYYANTYDPEATPDKKYGMYSMPEADESVISRAEDGAITVYVKMPSSQKRGFEVEVRQHVLTSLAVDSVLVTEMAPAEATKGTGDIRLMRAAVYVSGDRNPLTITGFEQTASELLVDRHIYATGHSTTFATTNEFTDSYVMDEKGVYYFWFIGSIDAAAEVGNVVSLALNNVVLGEQQIAPQGTASVAINVVSGAHGFYRIGSSALADYATLSAALQAISSIGMDGAVEIAIEPGTYTEQVMIPEISGAGAANTLTIRSLSGDYNDVLYQYNSTMTQEKGVFTIDGADYVTLKGLSFTSTYTSNQNPAVVVVRNAATHVTIDSCRIYAEPKTEYTARLDLLRVDAGENNYNNDFALMNSVLEGGYMGVYVIGHKAAADPLQQNMLISHNSIRNQGKQMVYGDAVSHLQIMDNTFRAQVKSSSANAIDWILLGGTCTIAENDIYYSGTAADNQSIKAIYIRPNSYQEKENTLLQVVNNVVNVQNGSEYASYCINTSSNMPKLLFAHNTMVMNSEGTASSTYYIEAAPTAGSVFVNNIFHATNKGYAVRYKNAAAIANIAFRHNVLYTPEATFGMPTATVSTFADWKTAVGTTDEDGNLSEAVTFASATLLIPRETNDGHLLTAEVMASIPTDVTGKTRAATPTIGAYEYDADLFRVPQMADGYPTVHAQDVKADVVLKTDNFGIAKLLILPAESAAPTMDELALATDEVSLIKDGEVIFTATGLTEETAYKAYVLLVSPIGEAASGYQEIAFTTAWTKRPVVINPIEKQTVASGSECTLTATLETEYDQAKPYSYAWRSAYSDAVIGTDATLVRTADQTTEYICSVTDRFGQKATVSAHVWVEKTAKTATFEEYVLAEDGHKHVDEAWTDKAETYLYSGTYAFANTPNKAYKAYTGYAICSDRSTEATGNYNYDQFRSAAGGAYEGNNFAVAYYSAPSTWYAGYTDPITLTNSTEPQTITGFYITNTVYTLDAILNGDYANDAFSQGDYMSVTAIGYNGLQTTGEVVFYLADYRSENSNEHFALDTWKWFDLSSLGAVTSIEFEIFTTKSDEYGFTTPTYFCLDNFGAEKPIGTDLEKVQEDKVQSTKVLRNGQIFVLRGEHMYDLNGRLIR